MFESLKSIANYQINIRIKIVPKIAWIRWILVGATLLWLATLLWFMVAGSYTRMEVDDYWVGNRARLFGWLSAQCWWYYTLNGRFTNLAVYDGFMLMGARWASILPPVTLALWILGLLWASKQWLSLAGLELSMRALLLPVATLLCLTIFFTPTVENSMMWEAGLIAYCMPLVFGTWLCGYLTKKQPQGSGIFLSLCLSFVCAFIIGGFSETATMNLLSFTLLGLGIATVMRRNEAWRAFRYRSMTATFGYMLSLVPILISPGNQYRIAQVKSHPSLHQAWVVALKQSTRYLHLTQFLYDDMMRGALFFVFIWAILLRIDRTRFKPTLVCAFGFVLLCFAFGTLFLTTGMYGYIVSGRVLPRLMIIPSYFLSIAFVVASAVFGVTISAHGRRWSKIRQTAIVAICLVGINYLYTEVWPYVLSSQCEVEKTQQYATKFDRQEDWLAKAKARGVRNVAIPSLGIQLAPGAIDTDRKSWLNSEMAQWYGFHSIVMSPMGKFEERTRPN